jgi:hypothetical protein
MNFFGMGTTGSDKWGWPTMPCQQKHSERVTIIRPLAYESTCPIDSDLFDAAFNSRRGKALTLNVSSGGMLLIMDYAPEVLQLLKVNVPASLEMVNIPTLAEVAWTRPLPLSPHNAHFVGVKFVL